MFTLELHPTTLSAGPKPLIACGPQAGGELRPGKKGLFLRREQWAALVGAADAITAALEARDRAYVLDIGPKCVSVLCGQL